MRGRRRARGVQGEAEGVRVSVAPGRRDFWKEVPWLGALSEGIPRNGKRGGPRGGGCPSGLGITERAGDGWDGFRSRATCAEKNRRAVCRTKREQAPAGGHVVWKGWLRGSQSEWGSERGVHGHSDADGEAGP